MTSHQILLPQLLDVQPSLSLIFFQVSGSQNNFLRQICNIVLEQITPYYFPVIRNSKLVLLFFHNSVLKIGCPMHFDTN
jgi:hypothetical protein